MSGNDQNEPGAKNGEQGSLNEIQRAQLHFLESVQGVARTIASTVTDADKGSIRQIAEFSTLLDSVKPESVDPSKMSLQKKSETGAGPKGNEFYQNGFQVTYRVTNPDTQVEQRVEISSLGMIDASGAAYRNSKEDNRLGRNAVGVINTQSGYPTRLDIQIYERDQLQAHGRLLIPQDSGARFTVHDVRVGGVVKGKRMNINPLMAYEPGKSPIFQVQEALRPDMVVQGNAEVVRAVPAGTVTQLKTELSTVTSTLNKRSHGQS